MRKKTPIIILVICLALMLSGCSNLIYHPTRTLYVNPSLLDPKPEEVKLKLSSKIVLHGWHFKPATLKTKGCVVYFHGNAQNRSSHFLHLYWIVKKGYELLIYDYPGYGQTHGSPTPENTVKSSVEVIRDVALTKSCKKLIIYGHSLGGQIAMRSVYELKNEITPDLLVVDSTFLSYQRIGSETLKSTMWTWLFSPISYVLLSDEWAISESIKEIKKTPIVIIHTKTDKVIPFSMGKEIFEKSKAKKEFWVKETGEHNSIFSDKEGESLRERLSLKLDQL